MEERVGCHGKDSGVLWIVVIAILAARFRGGFSPVSIVDVYSRNGDFVRCVRVVCMYRVRL